MNLLNLPHMLLIFIILLFPVAARAIPAITCHCFTDRSYDPARPALADPYFLATTQNSFFAAIFNIDKKSLVLKKQKGTSSDDLWVAYGISANTGVAPDVLLQTRQSKETWKDAIAALKLKPQALGGAFGRALQAGAATPLLAEAMVNDVILRYRLLDGGELAALRKAGATSQEIFLATLGAVRLKQPAREVFSAVRNGTKTWGKMLVDAGLDASGIQQEAAALVRSSRSKGS